MDSILKDVKYAFRGLSKSPNVTIIAVVALALGIGLTTVMFSIVYGALHRGLPFDGADRIMQSNLAVYWIGHWSILLAMMLRASQLIIIELAE